MNGTGASLNELRAIGHGFLGGLDSETEALVCVPATLLARAAEVLSTTPVRPGGQDCHAQPSGAHTGDISGEMLKDAGATHVIVGHSERRTDHHEDDATVHAKAEAAWRAGLVAIVCIGETRDQRDDGETLSVLSRQIAGSIPIYGGSVKPSNAVELLGIDNVDGALVGGSSLKAADFLGIAEAYLSM
jgi:triosephosphate isomerase